MYALQKSQIFKAGGILESETSFSAEEVEAPQGTGKGTECLFW